METKTSLVRDLFPVSFSRDCFKSWLRNTLKPGKWLRSQIRLDFSWRELHAVQIYKWQRTPRSLRLTSVLSCPWQLSQKVGNSQAQQRPQSRIFFLGRLLDLLIGNVYQNNEVLLYLLEGWKAYGLRQIYLMLTWLGWLFLILIITPRYLPLHVIRPVAFDFRNCFNCDDFSNAKLYSYFASHSHEQQMKCSPLMPERRAYVYVPVA